MDILLIMEILSGGLYTGFIVGVLLLYRKFNRFAREIKIKNEE